MMLLVVLGIVTMSGSPLSVLGESFLFRVDVTIPQLKGRNEMEDIKFINDTLNGLTDITVRYKLKSFDNQHVLLILELQKSCDWPSLTSALSSEGYQLSVTALETCTDYAKEVEVNMTYLSWTDNTDLSVVLTYDLLFAYEHVTSGEEYLSYVKYHMEYDNFLKSKGIAGDCYKSLSQMPFRFLYLGTINAKQEAYVDSKLIKQRKAGIDFRAFQNIRKYKEVC